jgi:hypothetical protein
MAGIGPMAGLMAIGSGRERAASAEAAASRRWKLGGLAEAEARLLLDAVLPGPIDERVRDQIIAETRGNPLALLELPRGLTPAELAGGFGLPGAVPLESSLEENFRRRVGVLPPPTRRLLLLGAADPSGDTALVWRAAARLGIGAEAAAPAAEAGLAEFGPRLRFRHPLVRSAAYRSAPAPDRQEAHRALAEATDPQLDPDRRAWHRAQAAAGPDEGVAAELERSASRAQARGGLAAAAAFLNQAATLTLDPARRAGRALAAAEATIQAGAFSAARRSAGPGRSRAAERFPAGARRPGPGPARVRHQPRQRCPAAAGQGGRAARADRSRPVPRDVPGRAVGRDLRRAPGRPWQRRAGRGPGRQLGARAGARPARARPAAGRPGRALQRRVPGGTADAAPGPGRLRDGHAGRRGTALAVAGGHRRDPGLG